MAGSDLRMYWDGSSADEMRDPPDGRSASEESETGKRQKPVPHLPALNHAQPYWPAACYCIRCFTESHGLNVGASPQPSASHGLQETTDSLAPRHCLESCFAKQSKGECHARY